LPLVVAHVADFSRTRELTRYRTARALLGPACGWAGVVRAVFPRRNRMKEEAINLALARVVTVLGVVFFAAVLVR